jgi:hypothetical protein
MSRRFRTIALDLRAQAASYAADQANSAGVVAGLCAAMGAVQLTSGDFQPALGCGHLIRLL